MLARDTVDPGARWRQGGRVDPHLPDEIQIRIDFMNHFPALGGAETEAVA